MRYRKLDAKGDYTFGNQQADFYRDSPEAVAQALRTRLLLSRGEWFIDTAAGTPWDTQVLGERTAGTRDMAIKKRILSTVGVTQLDAYTSQFDPVTRKLAVSVTITTRYGQTSLSEIL